MEGKVGLEDRGIKTDRRPAIYSRKSKFTGKGESIENQIELCRRYICGSQGEEAQRSALVYEDEGFSGGSLKRPMFRQMMRDARAGKISSIIVYRLDRISRNIGDFASLIEELNGLGISFLSIKEQFDTSSPMGRAMMYIASVFSQLERETIAERIRDNMQELAKTGRWLGGNTPTGYGSRCISTVSQDGRERKLYCLEQIPEEAELVREIFGIFLRCRTLAGTEKILQQRGLATKNGRPFSRFAVKGILTNPVYARADRDCYAYLGEIGAGIYSGEEEFDGKHGVIAYNRTLQSKGQTNRLREETEWILAVGKHEPLVSGADWVQVQRLLAAGRLGNTRRPKSDENEALLSGLLFCRDCGSRMRPKLTAHYDDGGIRRFFYLCTGKEKSGSSLCGAKNVDGGEMDRCAQEAIGKIPISGKRLLRSLERRGEQLKREGADRKLQLLNRKLEEAGRERRGILTALGTICGESGNGGRQREGNQSGVRLGGESRTLKAAAAGAETGIGQETAEYLSEELNRICREEKILRQQLTERELAQKQRIFTAEQAEKICRSALSLPEMMRIMGAEEKRRIVRSLIARIEWDGECAHIYTVKSEYTCR